MTYITDIDPRGKGKIKEGDKIKIGIADTVNINIGSGTVTSFEHHSFAAKGKYDFDVLGHKGKGTWTFSLTSTDGETYDVDFEFTGTYKDKIKDSGPISKSGSGNDTVLTLKLKDPSATWVLSCQGDGPFQNAKIFLDGVEAGDKKRKIYIYNSDVYSDFASEGSDRSMTAGGASSPRTSFNRLSLQDQKKLIKQFDAAFAKLDAGMQHQIKSFMRQSYSEMYPALRAATGREAGPAPVNDFGAEGVAMAYALFFEDPKQVSVLADIVDGQRQLGDSPSITPGGEIMSMGKYEQLDPFWVECVVVWLEYYFNRVDFPHSDNIVEIPDQTTLAITGDWGTGPISGTGPTPSLAMMNVIGQDLKPDYTIHLGDVYYAGTAEEEHDNFLSAWVAGTKGTFSLNSNHEMMAGGHGYFGTLLADPRFADQKGLSYFALENSHWIIVCLDSAYFADRDKMYGSGAIDTDYQLPFLKKMVKKAASEKKKVMVMTHHNGFSYDGGKPKALWKQVCSAFPDGTGPDYWYWGHAHVGAVYPLRSGTAARCCGHSGMPWGASSGLEKAKQKGDVLWYENTANLDRPPQVNNGFAYLKLDGETIEEAFYDQAGSKSWPSSSGGDR